MKTKTLRRIGDRRVKTWFALLPRRNPTTGQWHWLERVTRIKEFAMYEGRLRWGLLWFGSSKDVPKKKLPHPPDAVRWGD